MSTKKKTAKTETDEAKEAAAAGVEATDEASAPEEMSPTTLITPQMACAFLGTPQD